jgi:transposase
VSETLLTRLAMQVSDNTILRHFKNYARGVGDAQPIRMVGIDDWCWRRGDSYGTIIVDLERRKVVDNRKLRSSAETGADFMRKEHGKARHRQSRSRIGFISCRIYARQSSSK